MFSRTFLNVSYRISSQSNVTIQKITCHRSLHLACRNLRRDFIVRTRQCHHFQTPIVSAAFIRHISTETENVSSSSPPVVDNSVLQTTVDTSQVEDIVSQIPEPPTPVVSEIVEAVLAEPTFQSLGLGSWYPPGLIQQFLEFLHITVGLPWWGSIVLTTVSFKILVLPVVIKIQRYSARMHNVQPQIQYIQMQLTEARKMGDQMEVARLSHEMYEFMKEKGIDPIKNAAMPLIQAPIFLSFFWALRGMVQVPVDSLKTGGLWWFEDLTVPDPYYILPLLTSVTMAVTIEAGTDNIRVQSLGTMRYVLRALPVLMFPFIMNFEGAILCYWVSTNLFSLVQVSILRQPKVRAYCQIPEIMNHDPKKLPMTKKKFVQGFKDSWTNMKVAREVNARNMYDESVFEEAGKGPVPKTYKYDPTKRIAVNATMLSKKRD